MSKFDGYKLAADVDELISAKFKEHGMDVENAMDWLHFSRTVDTSTTIIDNAIYKMDGILDLLKRPQQFKQPISGRNTETFTSKRDGHGKN